MNEVTYRCENCGTEFEVVQGSRRRYCDPCTLKKMLDRHFLQGKCKMCGKVGDIVKHHQTYDMVSGWHGSHKGQVIKLCLSCHRKIHIKYPKRNNSANSKSG